MRDVLFGQQFLVIPIGAQAGQPFTFIGPPEEFTTVTQSLFDYYDALGWVPTSGVLAFAATGQYYYDINLYDNGPDHASIAHARGIVSSLGIVFEHEFIYFDTDSIVARVNSLTITTLGHDAQTYTPVFANTTIGTGGAVLGRYMQLGQFVWGFASLTLGTGGAISGLPDFTLPVALNAGVFPTQAPIGMGRFFDATGSRYTCQISASATTTGRFLYQTVSGTDVINANLGAGAPVVAAVGDQLFANFAYTTAA